MSYIDGNLLHGEKVVYRTHLHPVIFLKVGVFLALSLLCFIVAVFTHGSSAVSILGKSIPASVILGIVSGIIGALLSIPIIVRRITSEFAVTNKRVIIKVGFIRRTSIETLLTRIEGIDVDQSILGRMLGYGSIIVRGVGGNREPFTHIHHPLDFRKAVQEQIVESESGIMVHGREAMDEVDPMK
jgi:uncharacterized membrane protein YdbT with pleckstrin-like domain